MTGTGARCRLSGQALSGPAQWSARAELRLSARAGRDGVIVVDLDGEIDLSTAPRLVTTLQTLRTSPPGLLVLLDLSRLNFCDVTGLNAILRSTRMLAERSCQLALVTPPQSLVKLLKITGLDDYFVVLPSLAAAGIFPTAPPQPLESRPKRCAPGMRTPYVLRVAHRWHAWQHGPVPASVCCQERRLRGVTEQGIGASGWWTDALLARRNWGRGLGRRARSGMLAVARRCRVVAWRIEEMN
jgi:anti-sigma B factor antagonist